MLCKYLGWLLYSSELKTGVWFLDILLFPLNWGPAKFNERKWCEMLTYYRPHFLPDMFGWAIAVVCSHPEHFPFLYMFCCRSHLILFGISCGPYGNYSSCVYDGTLNMGITWTSNQYGSFQKSFYNANEAQPYASSQYYWEYKLTRCRNFWHMERWVSLKTYCLCQ